MTITRRWYIQLPHTHIVYNSFRENTITFTWAFSYIIITKVLFGSKIASVSVQFLDLSRLCRKMPQERWSHAAYMPPVNIYNKKEGESSTAQKPERLSLSIIQYPFPMQSTITETIVSGLLYYFARTTL